MTTFDLTELYLRDKERNSRNGLSHTVYATDNAHHLCSYVSHWMEDGPGISPRTSMEMLLACVTRIELAVSEPNYLSLIEVFVFHLCPWIRAFRLEFVCASVSVFYFPITKAAPSPLSAALKASQGGRQWYWCSQGHDLCHQWKGGQVSSVDIGKAWAILVSSCLCSTGFSSTESLTHTVISQHLYIGSCYTF